MPDVKCSHCHKIIHRKPYQLKLSKRFFCSTSHQMKYEFSNNLRNSNHLQTNESRKKLKIVINSKEVKDKIRASKIGERNPQYGKKRTDEWKRKMSGLMSGENNPFYGKKHSIESRIKMSISSKGQISPMKGKKHTLESKRKNSKNRTGKTAKEKNPAWKGGISNYNELLRGSRDIKEWRKNVFKRDDYICQNCKKKGCELNAHHIIPFSECISLDWKEEIFDIDNGLTLCIRCHKKIHQ